MSKAFFLDRDGTINVDTGYVDNPEKIKLLPGVPEAIKKINTSGYLVIVVSNQSGVARGYFDENTVKCVNERINKLLSFYEAHIDAFYYCPHLRNGNGSKYDIECDCRKPKAGMFLQAIKDYNLEISKCYACGDKERDVECLHELGMPLSSIGVLGINSDFTVYKSLFDFINTMI